MKIIIAGDYVPRNRVSTLVDLGRFECIFGEIREIVNSSDYAILNFESPIVENYDKPIPKCGPNLGCSEKAIDAIKYAGFKCVTLANNHIRDFGDSAVKRTIETLKGRSMDYVGAGKNLNEAGNVLYKTIDGKNLAVINCCEHEFSIATDKQAGANPLNPVQQFYVIQEAKRRAEYVLVIVHGGHEHYQLPSPRMVDTYRFFIDAGADAVVNHHQHCFSGYEIYHGKPIFYGLGNLCFDGNRSGKVLWHEGYMVALNFGESVEYEIIPYTQCLKQPMVQMIDKAVYAERIEILNTIISNSERLKQEIEKYYAASAKGCSNIFEPCRNRYYLGAKARGWLPSFISKKRKLSAANYVLCEAHRDKLVYWLNSNL